MKSLHDATWPHSFLLLLLSKLLENVFALFSQHLPPYLWNWPHVLFICLAFVWVLFYYYYCCSVTVVPIFPHYCPLSHPSVTSHIQLPPTPLSLSMGLLYMSLDLFFYVLISCNNAHPNSASLNGQWNRNFQ